MLLADRGDPVVVAHRAAHVDGQHGPGVRADLAFQIDGIHAERRVDIDQARDRAGAHDRADAADPHIAGDHHLIAWADAERGQGDMQRRTAAVHAERIPVPKGGAPFGFKPVDHALRVQPIKAERAAGVDHLIDEALLLIVDVVRAGQFPWQRRIAYRRAALYGQAVGQTARSS